MAKTYAETSAGLCTSSLLSQTQMLGLHHTDNSIVCVLHDQLWSRHQKTFDSIWVMLNAAFPLYAVKDLVQ